MAERKIAAKATVEEKSIPEVRDEADNKTFAKDYLVALDDPTNVPQEIIERNFKDVETTAIQRGLKPVGDVKLESKEAVSDKNVLLVYSVPVVPNS